MVLGREGIAPHMKLELNGDILEVVSFLKRLASCICETQRLHEVTGLKVGEGLKTLGAMNGTY